MGLAGQVGDVWTSAWDRVVASDPGFIRLLNALRIVLSVLLSVVVMTALHIPLPLLVTGATAAEVFSFAISDPHRRDQAITLALGLPTGLTALAFGALLAHHRLVSDVVCVLVIFAAAYARRFSGRCSALGVIAFQMFFITQFVRPHPQWLTQLCLLLVIGAACSAVVRFGLVPTSSQGTLQRLLDAFRARLVQHLEAVIDLARQEPGTPGAERAVRRLRRRTAALHQAALMIQDHLDETIREHCTAAHVQRRIAEAEVAAEHLAVLLTGALGLQGVNPVASDITERTGRVPPDVPVPLRTADEQVVHRLIADLHALKVVAGRAPGSDHGVGLKIVRDRLLGYRDDERLPDAPPAVQDVFRAIGEVSRALLGLRLALTGPDESEESPDDSPETVRCREELQTENAVLDAEDALREKSEEEGEPTGLERTTTRIAVQVSLASALAIVGGELLSPQRWYWAVLTCWVVFVNTSSAGEILVKGSRRPVGTLLGVLAGIGLAGLVGTQPWTAFTLVILCLFGTFYAISYAVVSFFVTAMIGLLYTLLHSFTPDLLVIRLGESALGAACAIVVGLLVLPVRTQERAEEQIREVLSRLREVTGQGVAELGGGRPVDLLHRSRALDSALADLRTTTLPLRHPITPLRRRRRLTRYVLGLLETAAYHARNLAAIAQPAPGSRGIVSDARLSEAAGRVDRNLGALIECLQTKGDCREPLDAQAGTATTHKDSEAPHAPGSGRRTAPETEQQRNRLTQVALRHLQRVDEDVLGLARPLGMGFKEQQARPDTRPAETAAAGR